MDAANESKYKRRQFYGGSTAGERKGKKDSKIAVLTSPTGTFVDRSAAQSIAGGAWGGTSNYTYAHSLGRAPDYVIPVLRSVQDATLPPILGALRGNASINTIRIFQGSVGAASAPIIEFEAISVFAHSIPR